MTNGDKIRQMTDEEILEFFFGPEAFLISMPVQNTQIINGMQVSNITTIRYIDWMKQEAQ